jgi:hypothetical protein
MRKSIWCVTVVENGIEFAWEGQAESQKAAVERARSKARSTVCPVQMKRTRL